jgi:NADH-quinone oxidoreductase subunit H
MIGYILENYIYFLVVTGVAIGMFLFVTAVALMFTLVERKLLGWMQQRLGPMEVGPWGLLQPIADAIKLLGKGDVMPKLADKFFYTYSPIISFAPAFIVFSLIPIASYTRVIDGQAVVSQVVSSGSSIGILLITAIMSVSVVGIMIGGWSSGNKFSLLGAVRSAAQEISYEVPKTIAILCIVMMAGSMNLSIIGGVQRVWFIIPQFLGFIIFVIASLAEVFRIPFDLAEGESELVAGYNVEFAGIRFVFFFFAEYTYLFVTGALVTVLFLGGGHMPEFLGFLNFKIYGSYAVSSAFWFIAKSMLLAVGIIWFSRSMPRVRADQLMNGAWKVLLPLSLVNVIYTAVIVLNKPLHQLFVYTLAGK